MQPVDRQTDCPFVCQQAGLLVIGPIFTFCVRNPKTSTTTEDAFKTISKLSKLTQLFQINKLFIFIYLFRDNKQPSTMFIKRFFLYNIDNIVAIQSVGLCGEERARYSTDALLES